MGKERKEVKPKLLPKPEPLSEPETQSDEEKYNQHLVDIGAVEKRTWFSVFVKVLFAVWMIGLISFIFMWITTGFQPISPTFPTNPKGIDIF